MECDRTNSDETQLNGGAARARAFKDYFSGHAAAYSAARPTYPPELFAYLAEACPRRERAWDCATGNGQAALGLRDHFAAVIATDGSMAQLRAADRREGVRYLAAVAEHAPLAEGSLDLVAVAQALHWFDLPRFYAEAWRVLRPGGLLAAWAYSICTIAPAIDAVMHRLYEEILGEYWAPERRLVEQGYRTLPFPGEELAAPRFELCCDWTLPQLLDYFNTWSALKNFERARGFSPLRVVNDDFATAWGAADARRAVRWPLHLRLGRRD